MRHEVTIIGNHQNTTALIASLIEDGLKPDLLVTLGDAARRKVTIANADTGLAGWARERGIAVYECDGYRLVSERDRAFFADDDFGIGVCTDWQHLVPGHVLDAFEAGIFGFHGSLMRFPNGRGRSPFNWSIRLGGRSIFNNCFRYTEGADDGGIFNTTEIGIGPDEPVRALQVKALVDSCVTIRRLIQTHRQGEVPVVPQPAGASVWLPKLTPEDSLLQFARMDIESTLNIIRASSHPFAGAYALDAAGERTIIWRATRYDGPMDSQWEEREPGAVLLAALDHLLVKCRDGYLLASEYEGGVAGPFV